MAKELQIRKDRTPVVLRKLAKDEPDSRISRRLLAIAGALDGMSRADAAKSAGMDRQTLRDWVIRYNKHGIAGLSDNWNGGRPPILTEDEQAELLAIVMAGPDPEKDGFCAFTRDDLVAIAKKKFRKSMHATSMGRLLRRLELSRQKVRPTHPMKDPAAAAAFKKSPANLAENSSACACISRTKPASGRRGAPAASGGSGANARRASSISATSTPTSMP